MIKIKTLATDSSSRARVTRMELNGVEFKTPIFMPVGTRATVKTLDSHELEELDFEILLGNTYHLYLRPGSTRIEAAGGLAKFMGYSGLTLTDSGGFQVYSLKDLRKIDEKGVEFRSIIDGSKHRFEPASVVQIQREIGADIMMAFDECPPGDADKNYVAQSMKKTHRWLQECVDEFHKERKHQHLFGIIQGGVFSDLRKESQEYVQSSEVDGIAVGGLSVGETRDQMQDVLSTLSQNYPEAKPRYLMGVGTPWDFLQAVSHGIDMFDCVMPSRVARHGKLYTTRGSINILNSKFREMDESVDEDCQCKVCTRYSASYLHHLFREKEFTALRLATYHNLYFFKTFMEEMRASIEQGTFQEFKKSWEEVYPKP